MPQQQAQALYWTTFKMTPEQQALQQQIREQLGVTSTFDVTQELAHRTTFLKDYLLSSRLDTLVIGVSGGVDSLAAGLLAHKAVLLARQQGYSRARLTVLHLPYGQQADADDAIACAKLMQPDQTLTVNIQAATDQLLQELIDQGLLFESDQQQDIIHGNIKARQRMVTLFAVAGALRGLVVGTDQAAEILTGYSTKFGDAAADVMPLLGLHKARVRLLAQHLGAPDYLVNKDPTADLESLFPMRPDEDSFGVSYEEIDRFLEGHAIDVSAAERLLQLWHASAHKRKLPPGPPVLGD